MLTKHTETADWYAIDFSLFTLDIYETVDSHTVTIVEHEASRRGGEIDQSAAFIDTTQEDWPNILYKLKASAEAGSPPALTQQPGFYRVKGTVTTSAGRTFVGHSILNVSAEGVTVA
jgi:hypothetical protein